MLMTILIVLLILALVGGGFGHARGVGYAGWSPLGIVLVIFLILFLMGRLH